MVVKDKSYKVKQKGLQKQATKQKTKSHGLEKKEEKKIKS